MNTLHTQTSCPLCGSSAVTAYRPLLESVPDICIFLLSSLGCASVLTYLQATLFDLFAAQQTVLFVFAVLLGIGISHLLFVLRRAHELTKSRRYVYCLECRKWHLAALDPPHDQPEDPRETTC